MKAGERLLWRLRRENGRPRVVAAPDAEALEAIGIDLDEVRRRIEESFGPGALERTRAGGRWLPPA